MDIAIIGMAVRFPHAVTLGEFAENLSGGVDVLEEISQRRRKATGLLATGNYQLLGHLEDIDLFEGALFGISRAEALNMCPQQRIIMELAYEVFENAGYNFEDFNGSRTSVYMGDTDIDYYEHAKVIEPTLYTGNMNSIIASRVSRFFNLRGKALMVDTTCSSSLVALHLACQDLAAGHSAYAMVGGINLLLFPPKKTTVDHLGIISPDGKAKTFSAHANGTSTGEGGVCLLLKPLKAARADKDIIHAVIKGSAANQDAGLSGSLTAPSSTAQAEVISEAWTNAGIDPTGIAYIEAHGTGTKLGDPIEVEGMNLAFKKFTDRKKFCAISSIKTNVGHTDNVAGIAGLVKAVLSMKRQEFFPSLHFDEPNPFIDFDHSAVFVNDKLRPWPRNGAPRMAGVSSFGMTGTNCHVVLQEEADVEKEEAPAGRNGRESEAYPIFLSARTMASLRKYKLELLRKIREDKRLRIEDISYTLLIGRKQYDCRYAVLVSTVSELEMALQNEADEGVMAAEDPGKVVFILSDWQLPAMDAIDLFRQSDLFGERYDACENMVKNRAKTVSYYQFAFQYSLYKLLEDAGIRIATVTGDEVGKLVIAAATNQIPLEEALINALGHVAVHREDFESRCRALLDKFIPGRVSFIEMGPLVGITAKLKSWLPEGTGGDKGGYKVVAVPGNTDIYPSDRGRFLAFIRSLYLEHFHIDVRKLFPSPFGRRVELPAYQWDRERYWLEDELANERVKDWCYELQWTGEEATQELKPLTGQQILLVAYPGDEVAAALIEKLTALGNTCYELRLGDSWSRPDDRTYCINAGSEEEYHWVSAELAEGVAAAPGEGVAAMPGEGVAAMRGKESKIERVIFLAGGDKEAVVQPGSLLQPDAGVYAHFYLCKAFGHLLPVKGMNWVAVTRMGQRVAAGERIVPSQAMHTGLLKGLQVDHLSLGVLCIDLGADEPQAADIVVKEMRQGNTLSYCAYRNGKRQVAKLMRIDTEPEYNSKELFPPRGVYVVTGGGTGIGMEICKSIARRQASTFLIIGRTVLPYKRLWDKPGTGDEAVDRRVAGLKELERAGSRVEYYSGDIGDEMSVRQVFDEIKRKYEKVSGVIHSAGDLMEDIPVTDMDESIFRKLLGPKVRGTILLDREVEELSPSFFVLFSSLNVWVPKRHSSVYTMANIFEDAYASRRSAESNIRYLSINWPGWDFTGASARMGAGLRTITPKDGASAFYYALQLKRAGVGIGDIDLSGFRNNPFFLVDQKAAVDQASAGAGGDAATNKAQPEEGVQLTVTEQTILSIWKDVLKSGAISIEDDFFEVGGHSLLGIQVVNRIEKELGIAVEFEVFFDYYTVRALAAYIDGLLPHDKVAEPVGHRGSSIYPMEEQQHYDVSYGQRRLWVVDQLSEESVYNLSASYVLNGQLDREALEAAYATLIGRHESLRTVLLMVGEVPRQRILDPGLPDFSINYFDLRDHADRYETATRLVREAETIRLDLQRGPLITAQLIRLEAEQHYFSFTMHHIIADAWSIGIFTRDLIRFYNEYRDGKAIACTPLDIQFRDYASWQGRLLSTGEFSGHRQYWLDQFSGPISVLNMPADLPRPLEQTSAGGSVDILLGKELVKKIREQAGKSDVTNFMLLFSVVNILLYRYTGQREIVVGTVVTERGHYDLEDQVGFYVNTLPLKTNLDEEDNFSRVVEKVKKVIVDANKHKDYPLELIIKDIDLIRTSHFPLFDVVAQYQNTAFTTGETGMEGIEVSKFGTETEITQFNLIFDFYEWDEDMVLKLIFNRSMYTHGYIMEMGRHFERLLQAAMQLPAGEIDRLDMLASGERSKLLVEFNGTRVDFYPANRTLTDLFEERAADVPEYEAIVFAGQGITYGELNRRANAVANHLRMIEAPGARIGLYAMRGPEMIIGMLGILKAGCAYVPLNTEYPAGRLHYLIENSGIRYILCTDRAAADLKRLGEVGEVILLEECRPSDMENPGLLRDADSEAYVLYTSGTTGNPKGVRVSHRNAIQLIYDPGETAIRPGERVLQWSTYSFDASVYEIFGTLLAGGTLFLLQEGTSADVFELARVIETYEISLCFLTTAVFNAFIDLRPESLKRLRRLLFGGEMVSRKHVGKAVSLLGEGKVTHLYGPTETTVFVTAWPASRAREDGAIPIGKPLAGARLYVLDRMGQPVPVGIAGELLIGGTGVALGYLNDEALTREKFVADDFSGKPGAKLYKTGDLVRWLADGNIEFIGRVDNQVKIRGNRIEPGEVEGGLLSHPDVREAVVVVREREEGDKVLVAYVTAQTELRIPELYLFLEKTLPVVMLPYRIIQIEKMPLVPSGKTDRRSLPEIDLETAGAVKTTIAPRDETEKRIAEIWKEVLGMEISSVEDNFFANGGHSLNALRVISEIHKQLGVRCGLKDVFLHPTVSAMAARVKGLKKSAYASIAVVEEQDHYPVSSAQRGVWIQHQFHGPMAAYNIPLAYVFEGNLQKDVLERAFALLIGRHEILRTTFIEVDGEPRQRVAAPESCPFTIRYTDLGGVEPAGERVAERIRKIGEEEASRLYHLDEFPLLSARLVRADDNRHYFFFTIHHIIADGWSMEVIIHEVVTWYNLLSREEEVVLRPPSMQYKDYAAYQQRFMTTPDLPAEVYWRGKLGKGTMPLQLPLDFPRPSRKTFNSDSLIVVFDGPMEEAIRNFCQRNELSLVSFFSASVQVLLYLYTGQRDIAVGMPDSGRHQGDLQEQVGFYLNMLVLRSELSGEEDLVHFCRKVKADILESLEFPDYPFDLLVQRSDKRDLARNPLFDVEVAFTNFSRIIKDKASEMDDITVSPFTMEMSGGGKFDLDFLFSESGSLGLQLFFNTDLFRKDTAVAMELSLEMIMRRMIGEPGLRVGDLRIPPVGVADAMGVANAVGVADAVGVKEAVVGVGGLEAERVGEPVSGSGREPARSRLKGIQGIKPRTYREWQDLVTVTTLAGAPVTLSPCIPGVNVNEWIKSNREKTEKLLQVHGALLFRGFSTHTVDSFELFLQCLSGSIMKYVHRSSPRHSVQNNIYTSTDHPSDQMINMHNEHSYSHEWPMKIAFYCHKASAGGGETPIADSRKILAGLRESTVRKFLEKQVMYIRKTSTGLGMKWQDIFQTSDKGVVEESCRRYQMDFSWEANDSLRMTFVRPAVRYHPRTKEAVWFNHAFFFNPFSLAKAIRDVVMDQGNDGLLPFRTYYGDGSEIEEEVIAEIMEVYERNKVIFGWKEGDILLLDNMLSAHGRNPYQGERKILVGMSEPQAM